ncbi:MAG: MoxR family ATPase [Kiritimatiellae bacterium]|nr:MoxR family ATPase [Kiritimatiellia bacterium]
MPAALKHIVAEAARIVVGVENQVRLALCCLLARGHLLIEDLPGIGKTTLAHALARILGLQYQRIQFTSDLLPADVLGVSVFSKELGAFQFHPGPIFAQVVLADEINRATPKAQSALLEAMEERQVTIEGQTRPLPQPFFVIATQNPTYVAGTFPLPESQLDRFLMRVALGYPHPDAERTLLEGEDRRDMLARIKPLMEINELLDIQAQIRKVHVAGPLLDYLQALLAFSRQSRRFRTGLSPRAGLNLQASAKAWAFLEGRDHVIPEDLQAVLESVVAHRLTPAADEVESLSQSDLVRILVESVPIP